MRSKKNQLTTAVVLFILSAILLSAWQQFSAYKSDTQTTQRQLRLNTLKGELAYLDEALTMSAQLYVLTADTSLIPRYNNMAAQYYKNLFEIDQQFPGTFNGKAELQSAGDSLYAFELAAFALVESGRLTDARSLLSGKPYSDQKKIFIVGLRKLASDLDASVALFLLFHQRQAMTNAIVIGVLLSLILIAWYLTARIRKKWQYALQESQNKRTKEAMQAAVELGAANEQLRLLSIHLQDVREKERIAIANDINEELGQQLSSIKVRVNLIEERLKNANLPYSEGSRPVTAEINDALVFLRNLASNAYPLVLRDLGLIEALDWESQRISKKSSRSVVFFSELEELPCDLQLGTTIFRTYQEKLNELILKGATEMIGSITLEGERLILSIQHDAIDVPDMKLIEELAIQERVESIKGKVEMDHDSEEGNRFILSIPYTKPKFHARDR